MINSDAPEIQMKAKEIVGGLKTADEKASALFYFARDSIKYRVFTSWPEFDDFRATTALASKENFCIPKAILLVALSRAVKIPARLRFADIRNLLIPPKLFKQLGTDIMLYHGYAELHLDGWIKANPAFDAGLCDRHGFVPVDFNGRADALFHHHDLQGKKHVEYIDDRGYFSDFTRGLYDQMMDDFARYYMPLMKRD